MNIQKAARFPVSYHKMVIPSMYVHNGTMLHHPLYLRQQKMMFRMFLNMFLHFWMVFSRSPTGVGKCPNSWDFGHDQNRSVLNMISKKKHDYWLSETFHWLFNVIHDFFPFSQPSFFSCWWFETFFIFPYVENNDPNWRTPSFFRWVGMKPPTRWIIYGTPQWDRELMKLNQKLCTHGT